MTEIIFINILSALFLAYFSYRFVTSGLFRGRPLTFIFIIFSLGSIILNIFFTSTYLVLPLDYESGMLIYSLPTFILCFLLLFYRNLFPPKIDKTISDLPSFSFYLIAFFPFIIVSLYFIYHGISSGSIFSSQDWRSSISESASGYLYLIFNSGAVILAAFISTRKIFSLKSFLFLIFIIILLLSYGGRFLAALSLILGFGIYLSKNNSPGLLKIFSVFVLMIFLSFALAFFRYTLSEQISNDIYLFLATLQRQLSGNVYDFLLSFSYVNQSYAQELIFQKFKVSALPFVFEGSSDFSLGSYLAYSAAREFEFGHRVSAIGESFYAFGLFGPMFVFFIMIALVHIADVLLRKSSHHYLAGLSLAASVFFAFFIDLSFLFTSVYLISYLVVINIFCVMLRRFKYF